MDANGAHDLEEIRTRRSVLAAAGGLLLPAGLLAGTSEDADARRRAKRHRGRRPGRPGMFANDTIIKFRNGSSQSLQYWYRSYFAENLWNFKPVAAGKETGWMEHFPVEHLTLDAILFIRTGAENDPSTRTYRIRCRNYEIGTPDVLIEYGYVDVGRDPWNVKETLADNVNMGEGVRMVRSDEFWTFNVHRWSNGKEDLDGQDEWYTRFFVSMSPR